MKQPKFILPAALFVSFSAFSQPADLINRAESDPRAQFELGQVYANSIDVPKNNSEALKWFSKAASANNADAIARIGLMYEHGDGVAKDTSKAVEFYKRSVQLGGNRGMIAYANALIQGTGIKKNKELGHDLLKTAVSNNSSTAKYVLGAYYRSGELHGNTPWKSLVSDAADRGNDDASILLLIDDIEGKKDPEKAEKSFNKLIKYKGKNGVVDTTIAYYYLYYKNPPDIKSAKDLLEPLASDGNSAAILLMTNVSMLAEDYPNMLRYMREANKNSPGTFDVERFSAEYKKILQAKEKQEQEQARQSAFITATTRAQQASASALNDMQRGGIKAERDSEICSLMKSKSADNWVGYIDALSANSDGLGVLSIAVAKGVTLKTWNNSLSDIGSKTLISPDSQLFKKASQMQVGQKVAFSGVFISGSSRECLREASLSLSGALRSPEYIFRFTDITAIQ